MLRLESGEIPRFKAYPQGAEIFQMMIEEIFGNSFKLDIQASGAKLFAQEKVSISSSSDTGVHAYLRAAPPLKVRLSSTDIASESFQASCTCPAARKERLCKHIWATLLAVEQLHPDFLSSKREIEMAGPNLKPQSTEQSTAQIEKRAAAKQRQDEFAAAARFKASTYRKEQYQKAKARSKGSKKIGRNEPVQEVALIALPMNVEAACAYFSSNGFPMIPGPSEEVASEAKKKLSRVFHPDKGGTHQEIVELNRNWEVIMEYLRAF